MLSYKPPLFLGADIGSRNTKIVLLDAEKSFLHSSYEVTGVDPLSTYKSLIEKSLQYIGASEEEISLKYSTGYGRKLCGADKVVSEITCHAFGVRHYFSDTQTIIDIGGQDSKIISINDEGHIRDFAMNDKCAAGTGRFLEMVAVRLGIPCSELSKMAAKSDKEIHLSSTCVVFAESEIIGLISERYSPEEIARAAHFSIAERVVAQLNQLDWRSPLVFTGGVAQNEDLKNLIALLTETDIAIPPDPEITGALGAALIAWNDYGQD